MLPSDRDIGMDVVIVVDVEDPVNDNPILEKGESRITDTASPTCRISVVCGAGEADGV